MARQPQPTKTPRNARQRVSGRRTPKRKPTREATPWTAETPAAKLYRLADAECMHARDVARYADILEREGLIAVTADDIAGAEALHRSRIKQFQQRFADRNARILGYRDAEDMKLKQRDMSSVVVETPTVDKPKQTTPTAATTPTKQKPKTKTAVGKDRFGCKMSSQAATINAAITDKPQTIEDIVRATKMDRSRVKSHLKAMQAKGFVDAKYRSTGKTV